MTHQIHRQYFHNSTVQTFKIRTLKVSAITSKTSSQTIYFITLNSFVLRTSPTIGQF